MAYGKQLEGIPSDLDLLTSRTSRNETNHFHIYIDDDVEYHINGTAFDASNLTDKQYGTLIHEYVHYIQHIQTLYGVNQSRMFNKLFIEYAEYLAHNERIEMPLLLDDINTQLKDVFQTYVETQGPQSYNHSIGDVEVIIDDIIKADKNRTSVRIPVYDFEGDEILEGENGYHFGYWAIIEGMAHHIQKLIDPTVEESHPTVPYKIIDLIIANHYPDFKSDDKLIISLCYISLLFDNPGVGFFKVAEHAKAIGITDGRSLYKECLLYTVRYKNKEVNIRQMLQYLHGKMLEQLKIIACMDIVYYKKVYEQIGQELSIGESALLDIVYEDRISDKNLFNDIFLQVYGFPVIESNKSTLLQKDPMTGKPYRELAGLAAWELLFKRITNTKSTLCGRYKLCHGSDIMTPSCRDAQWTKKEKCLLREAFRIYGSKVKEWIQKKSTYE